MTQAIFMSFNDAECHCSGSLTMKMIITVLKSTLIFRIWENEKKMCLWITLLPLWSNQLNSLAPETVTGLENCWLLSRWISNLQYSLSKRGISWEFTNKFLRTCEMHEQDLLRKGQSFTHRLLNSLILLIDIKFFNLWSN